MFSDNVLGSVSADMKQSSPCPGEGQADRDRPVISAVTEGCTGAL